MVHSSRWTTHIGAVLFACLPAICLVNGSWPRCARHFRELARELIYGQRRRPMCVWASADVARRYRLAKIPNPFTSSLRSTTCSVPGDVAAVVNVCIGGPMAYDQPIDSQCVYVDLFVQSMPIFSGRQSGKSNFSQIDRELERSVHETENEPVHRR